MPLEHFSSMGKLLNYLPVRPLLSVTGFEPILQPWEGCVLALRHSVRRNRHEMRFSNACSNEVSFIKTYITKFCSPAKVVRTINALVLWLNHTVLIRSILRRWHFKVRHILLALLATTNQRKRPVNLYRRPICFARLSILFYSASRESTVLFAWVPSLTSYGPGWFRTNDLPGKIFLDALTTVLQARPHKQGWHLNL